MCRWCNVLAMVDSRVGAEMYRDSNITMSHYADFMFIIEDSCNKNEDQFTLVFPISISQTMKNQ